MVVGIFKLLIYLVTMVLFVTGLYVAYAMRKCEYCTSLASVGSAENVATSSIQANKELKQIFDTSIIRRLK